MVLAYDGRSNEYRITLKGTLSHTVTLGADVFGNITRLDNALENLAGSLQAEQNSLEETKAQLENARTELATPFAREEELAEKTARLKELNILFALIPDNDASFNFLVSLLYASTFQELFYSADRVHGGSLPVPVHFLMDEFANVSLPDDFDKLLATMRSRNISVSRKARNYLRIRVCLPSCGALCCLAARCFRKWNATWRSRWSESMAGAHR